jgi:hypothetical protein
MSAAIDIERARMNVPLWAFTIGRARFHQDFDRSGSMVAFGGL